MEEISIKNAKNLIRKAVREDLKLLSKDDIASNSSKIFDKIEQLRQFKQAKNIMIYWSMPEEVQTLDAIRSWSLKKSIYLPCIQGDELVAKLYISDENMQKSIYNIPEPDTDKTIDPMELDLIIVPGLAFDSSKKRLGKGKGYYDKFLEHSWAQTVGICFSIQLLENIPVESFDLPMDIVITEHQLFS